MPRDPAADVLFDAAEVFGPGVVLLRSTPAPTRRALDLAAPARKPFPAPAQRDMFGAPAPTPRPARDRRARGRGGRR